jgi:hypothetical protein
LTRGPGRLRLPAGGAGLRRRVPPKAGEQQTAARGALAAARTSVLFHRPTHREPRARNAGVRALTILGFIGVLLAVDTQVDARAQLLLGLAAWIALIVALRGVPPLLRAQALVVVVVATCAEIVGSIIWGVYTYRLENLPSFVPPCHGLVYLAGAALPMWAAPRKDVLVRFALVAVVAWGVAGVTVLPRSDVGGAIGACLLAIYLVRGRVPEIYAGVFLVVAWLELYGTAIGTWEWAAVIPGTDVSQGNPPSGVASGYVWFDIVALALAPRLIRLGARIRPGSAALPDSA